MILFITENVIYRIDVSGVILTVICFIYLYYEKYGSDLSVLVDQNCVVYFALSGFI
jgi:hypothetical protein